MRTVRNSVIHRGEGRVTHYNKEREEHSRANVGTIGHIDHGKTHLAKSIAGAYPQPSDWPSPERIEIIASNGNDGLHYEQKGE